MGNLLQSNEIIAYLNDDCISAKQRVKYESQLKKVNALYKEECKVDKKALRAIVLFRLTMKGSSVSLR